jgi:hypothetical protein
MARPIRRGGVARLCLAGTAAALACLIAPAPASAHLTGMSGHAQEGLLDFDGAQAGADHAQTHAAQRRAMRRAAARWEAMTPAERSAELAEEEAEQRSLELAAGPPEQDGAWTTAPFPIPTFAIHTVVLPTGKVMFWGYPPVGEDRPNEAEAWVWDPSQGTGPASLTEVPPPVVDADGDGSDEIAPIYCSGQSLLPTGEVLVTGGNLLWPTPENGYAAYAGTREVFTFNPFDETWTQQPSMRQGRWYPTQVELSDGRTAILGGFTEESPGGALNRELELFTPPEEPGGIGRMEYVEGADRDAELYPLSYLLRDGSMLTGAPAGPGLFDPESLRWSSLPPHQRSRTGGAGVLLPDGPGGATEVMVMGGAADSFGPEPQVKPAYSSSEILDTEDPGTGWRDGPSYNVARSMANVVQLPDGSMVSVGGGRGFKDGGDAPSGFYVTDEGGTRKQIEIYDPASQSWRLGPPQQEDRTYHSTAVLLPDGRVFSAGDDFHPAEGGWFSTSDTAEIYSPPYLHRGERPRIESAPDLVGYGEEFSVATSGPAAERAVLMAPAATTHAVDMQQRHVELEIASGGSGAVDLIAPEHGGIAPPGYYMLFLLNDEGVPSVARWVRLSGDAAPPQPPALTKPKVGFTIQRRPKGRKRPRLLARVTVDRSAALEVSIVVRGKRKRVLARRTARIQAPAPGLYTVKVKLGRGAAKRVRNAKASVTATGDGGATTWSRTVRLRPTR